MHIELFIDEKWVDLLMILRRVLDEDIYNTRDSCTSHATENIDYLTHPLSFELFEVKANHLLVPVNVSIKP